ncbi:hypothetical protein [Nostoc sp. DedQUE09]|uniref:hypothetical protein n=1 Tax=Nostoc sp. DedQUE09 TaxID=3075394 RepID=UPI002AD5711D|nr:hypothetical protein [Nostoc sp. DedQUE09]MDZ7952887.1 hypothetical protein [Nostoc sp. DedQUE09]
MTKGRKFYFWDVGNSAGQFHGHDIQQNSGVRIQNGLRPAALTEVKQALYLALRLACVFRQFEIRCHPFFVTLGR